MANAETTASDEREGLSVMLLVLAVARRIEAKTTGDQRFVAAASSVKQIERTLHRVDDVTLLKLASINAAVDGLLSTLIAVRLEQVGFALPLYPDAAAFFQPVLDHVDAILRKPPADEPTDNAGLARMPYAVARRASKLVAPPKPVTRVQGLRATRILRWLSASAQLSRKAIVLSSGQSSHQTRSSSFLS